MPDQSENHLLQQRLSKIQDDIARRQPEGRATLVAITKYASDKQMLALYEAGIRHFGENKIQDALLKKTMLPPAVRDDIHWHFIGHLQGNKVSKAVGEFGLIHSVDSLALAEKIHHRAVELGICQNILCQVNISAEPSKGGFSQSDFLDALPRLLVLENIRLCGLMAIAPHPDAKLMSPQETFERLQALFNSCDDYFSKPEQRALWQELSMGMSSDYPQALEAGATIIRIGQFLISAC